MRWPAFILSAAIAYSQTPSPAQTPPVQTNDQQQDLQRAVNEAGTSAIDLTRVLEEFLKKYPNPTQLKEIERALAKAAIDNRVTTGVPSSTVSAC